MRPLDHFKTVGQHRALVRKYCFHLGLYWQGATHDLSKYSPTEFMVGAKYFQGDRSPNNAEREDKGYSSSWLHDSPSSTSKPPILSLNCFSFSWYFLCFLLCGSLCVHVWRACTTLTSLLYPKGPFSQQQF